MWHDLELLVSQQQIMFCGFYGIDWSVREKMLLELGVYLGRTFTPDPRFIGQTRIRCHGTLDWGIRPLSPGVILGGPLIEIHSEVRMDKLQGLGFSDVNTTEIPHSDGERFDPPLRLKLLLLDRSFVLAQRFEIEGREH
jgi:hypothetical protein